jgi:hypothetical protein
MNKSLSCGQNILTENVFVAVLSSNALFSIWRIMWVRLRLKCSGTRVEARFRLSVKRTSPFKSAGALVQSTTGSRCMHISGSNAGYTKFRGSVKGTGYWLPTPFASFPFTSFPMRHRVLSRFNWTLGQTAVSWAICNNMHNTSTFMKWHYGIISYRVSQNYFRTYLNTMAL